MLDAGALDDEFEGALAPGNVTLGGTEEGRLSAGSEIPLSGRGSTAAGEALDGAAGEVSVGALSVGASSVGTPML